MDVFQCLDIILPFLLESLTNEDKIEFISCSKYWYYSWMKRWIRKLRLVKWNEDSNYNQFITALITNPLDQLAIVIETFDLPDSLLSVIHEANYSFRELSCNFGVFGRLLQSCETLKVKTLTVRHSTDNISSHLLKVSDCEQLSIQFISQSSVSSFPYIPSLTSLSLEEAIIDKELTLKYFRTLHHLHLYCCSVSDVTMLGSVPFLELRHCMKLVDISGLNANRHVIIQCCNMIQDYTHSFAKSEKIEIYLPRKGDYYFAMTNWTQVKDLTLVAPLSAMNINHQTENYIPTTVRKCWLEGNFVSSINFTINAGHVLKDLKLLYDFSIVTLEGYGLERVERLKCDSLFSLQSLEGLGRGRNRKISISRCDNITDFSPLKFTPIIEITECAGFSTLPPLPGVKHLSIGAIQDIKFYENFAPHSLFISSNTQKITYFTGLEHIPYLELDESGYLLIQEYLDNRNESEGNQGRLFNQRVEFVFETKTMDRAENLLNLHYKYLKDDYDYYNILPKKWIWVRKRR